MSLGNMNMPYGGQVMPSQPGGGGMGMGMGMGQMPQTMMNQQPPSSTGAIDPYSGWGYGSSNYYPGTMTPPNVFNPGQPWWNYMQSNNPYLFNTWQPWQQQFGSPNPATQTPQNTSPTPNIPTPGQGSDPLAYTQSTISPGYTPVGTAGVSLPPLMTSAAQQPWNQPGSGGLYGWMTQNMPQYQGLTGGQSPSPTATGPGTSADYLAALSSVAGMT